MINILDLKRDVVLWPQQGVDTEVFSVFGAASYDHKLESDHE